jgi:bacteriorhodopsin
MYGTAAVYITFIWLLYPVCWGLGEGGNVISVDHEMVFYSILDLFAGPVFIFAFLAAVETVEYDALGLQSGKASDYVNVPRPSEKARETREPREAREETGAA